MILINCLIVKHLGINYFSIDIKKWDWFLSFHILCDLGINAILPSLKKFESFPSLSMFRRKDVPLSPGQVTQLVRALSRCARVGGLIPGWGMCGSQSVSAGGCVEQVQVSLSPGLSF